MLLGAVALASAAIAWSLTAEGTSAPTLPIERTPPAQVDAPPARGPLAAGVWDDVPEPPVSWTTAPAAVWTGREVLMWGEDAEGMTGVAYAPARRRWRTIADTPLSRRSAAITEWVPWSPGSDRGELIVWGGRTTGGQGSGEGAAYDPDTDSWRVLPEGPLAPSEVVASTVVRGGLVVVSGDPDDGAPAPGAIYLVADDVWEEVPDLPPGIGQLAALVGTGREALALLAPELTSGEARTYSWQRGNQRWHELPAAPVGVAGELAAAAEEETVAVWAGDGTSGQLLLFDARIREWDEEAPATPSSGSGTADVTWVDGKVVLWWGLASAGALYAPDSGTWEEIEGPPSGHAVLAGGPAPVWTGNELVVLGHRASTWRPDGSFPTLTALLDVQVHLSTSDRVVTVDVASRSVGWRRAGIGPPTHPSNLVLSAGHLIAPRSDTSVHAIPLDGGEATTLEATLALPAGGDEVWLLRRGRPWTAVRARGDGTELTGPLPLPEGSWPMAGLSHGIVVQTDDGIVHWDVESQTSTWSSPDAEVLATGARFAAGCPTADDGSPRCEALFVMAPGSAPASFVEASGWTFQPAHAAFSPDDVLLATAVHTHGDSHGIAIISPVDGEAHLRRAAVLETPHAATLLAWHPSGEWLLAPVGQRLLAIHAEGGGAFDVGIALPDHAYQGMVVAHPELPPVGPRWRAVHGPAWAR